MAHGGPAVAHGGARPRSGMTGPAWSVRSSQELLHAMGKTRRGLRMEEWCGGALAAVSAISGDAQPWRRWWKRSQRPYLSSSGTTKRWRTERRTRRSSRRADRRVFVVVRKLGGGGARSATKAERLRLGCCCYELEKRKRARRSDWRGRGASSTSSRPARGAVRTIRARGGHAAAGLCCRSAMTGLKVTFQRSSSPTDRRTLTPINS